MINNTYRAWNWGLHCVFLRREQKLEHEEFQLLITDFWGSCNRSKDPSSITLHSQPHSDYSKCSYNLCGPDSQSS